MSESDRVQRWRDTKRQQGLEPMTIWLSREDKARLVDMAQRWHRSPSEMIREALAQFDPVSSRVTATETDTEQLRALIRDELVSSPMVTATVTDTIADTLPALVRQIVEEMALEALGAPVADTNSYVTDTEAHREAPTQRKRGSPDTMRQRILALLREYEEGLTAEQIRTHLKVTQPIGDTLQSMRRAGVVKIEGEGNRRHYFAMDEQSS
jgi:predicted transcriptional regulator